MRRLAVLAALVAAPVLSPLGSPAHAEEPVWPDVVGIAREVVRDATADGCLEEYLIRPAQPYQFVTVDGLTVTVYGGRVVGAVTGEAAGLVRFVDCTV